MDTMIFDTGYVVYLRMVVGIGIVGVVIMMDGIVNSNVVAFRHAAMSSRRTADVTGCSCHVGQRLCIFTF